MGEKIFLFKGRTQQQQVSSTITTINTNVSKYINKLRLYLLLFMKKVKCSATLVDQIKN